MYIHNDELAELRKENQRLKSVLDLALNHCLSNRGLVNEFYNCNAHNPGRLPKWVRTAKKVLKEKTLAKVEWV